MVSGKQKQENKTGETTMRGNRMVKLAVVIGTMCVALCGGSRVMAQGSSSDVVTRAVAMIALAEENGGQISTVMINTISDNAYSTHTLTLEKNVRYTIIGIGDGGRMQDLDLYVYDGNDNEVGRDSDSTNVAVVEIEPRWTGKFSLKVDGYAMSHRTAFYAIIVVRN